MRVSSIFLAAASLLVTSTNAECGQLAPSDIAILAHCGNAAELAECLTPGDKCIKKCLTLAGCSDVQVKSFEKWFHNDCKETRTFSDLRKRQKNNSEEEENAEETPAPAANTKAADPGTAKGAETKAADPGTEPVKTPAAVITPAETAAAAPTDEAPKTVVALSTPDAETSIAAPAQITTEIQPDQTITATVTDSSGKTILTTAAASIATLAKPLVCLITRLENGKSCTKEKGAATEVCVPTKTPVIACAPGLLCQMTEKGNQICMERQDTPTMAGTIVIVCLAVFLATMCGSVIFMACKTKKEQQREKKQAEALAIANGMRAPGAGGAAATEAYVPLIGGRGRTRDSSANPFGGNGSGRNSRRPSTLGMGATSPGGYGGMSEARSPVDSRAPSPLGMPGATEDLSYGGGRRI